MAVVALPQRWFGFWCLLFIWCLVFGVWCFLASCFLLMSDLVQYGITTRDLCLWYGKFQALINITTNIKKGIITSLIGPSGCGKTTLLRCFNRINERYDYVITQ